MVRRYPHTAVVTSESNGRLVDGEWQDGVPIKLSIRGRYEPVSDGRIVMKANALGNEKQVHGYFYTNTKPNIDTKYQRLRIDSLGIDVDVICWDQYQSHSVINV